MLFCLHRWFLAAALLSCHGMALSVDGAGLPLRPGVVSVWLVIFGVIHWLNCIFLACIGDTQIKISKILSLKKPDFIYCPVHE